MATSAQTLSFTWDALGRNLTQVGPQGTASAAYDVGGRRTQLTYPGGAFYVTYDYDVTGQVTAIKEGGSTTLASFAYDDLGRRTTLTRGNGVVTSYGYDNASRLTSLGLDLTGTADDLALTFGYNAASQIASTTRSNDGYAWTGAATGTTAYASNGLNQLTAAGGASLTFDARGNTTAIGGASYGYTSENMLTSGPGSAALVYDPLGRLYQVGASGFATTRFAYDGQNMIGEYDTSGNLVRRYVHGPGTDEPLVEYDASGNRTYLAADERGSIVSRSSASGAPTAKNSYDEYGNPGSANAGRYGYTGQVWLVGLGMNYYKARMYHAGLGRFMQTDPVGYWDGLNWYNYTGGDPVNLVDPSGLDVVCSDGETISNDVPFPNGDDVCTATGHGRIAEIEAGGGSAGGGNNDGGGWWNFFYNFSVMMSGNPSPYNLDQGKAWFESPSFDDGLPNDRDCNPTKRDYDTSGVVTYHGTEAGGSFGGIISTLNGSFQTDRGFSGTFETISVGFGPW